MRKFSLGVAVLLTLSFGSSAFAAGYGSAGCGFGGNVIDRNDILAQLGASTLNDISGNQTFAISSGTSGCGKSGLVLAEKEQKVFVENNYQDLAKQMAVGGGEDLTALAGLLGCPAEHSGDFGAFTQNNYSSIFLNDETTPNEMLSVLKMKLSTDEKLSQSCQRI